MRMNSTFVMSCLCRKEIQLHPSISQLQTSPADVVPQQLGHQVDGLDESVEEGVEAATMGNDKVALQRQ